MSEKEMILAYYRDKGPSGPCAQDGHTTRYWRHLMVFDSRESCRKFIESARSHRVQPTLENIHAWCVVGDDSSQSGELIDDSDAINLARRILEHFEAMPGKEELEKYRDHLQRERDHVYEVAGRIDWHPAMRRRFEDEIEQAEATIAKLRRLVGKGEE